MSVTFQITRRYRENAGVLADNLLGNLERLAGWPYNEIVHIEELRNDNEDRVIQIWGYTCAYVSVGVPDAPSSSQFLLKITDLGASNAQAHILLLSICPPPTDGYYKGIAKMERERQERIAAKLLEFCSVPQATPWTDERDPLSRGGKEKAK